MAVVNEYVNSKLASSATRRRTMGRNVNGQNVVHIVQTFEVAAADDDGSVYRLFPNVPSSAVLSSLRLACDALTGATDYDMGLYAPNYGAVADKDILADGLNPSAGYSRILALDALKDVNISDCNKTLYELLGLTVKTAAPFYDICLTANTVGSGAGTITVFGSYFTP